MLKVRLPYAYRLVPETAGVEASKRHEMRSKPMAAASGQRVTPGTWVWFATLKGKLPGIRGCAVIGGARFIGEEGPLVPGTEHGEARWLQLQHTVPGTLRAFVKDMPSGYSKHVWAWEFADAIALASVVEMADSHEMTFVSFVPRC